MTKITQEQMNTFLEEPDKLPRSIRDAIRLSVFYNEETGKLEYDLSLAEERLNLRKAKFDKDVKDLWG